MKALDIYEIYVRPAEEWKMLASFETEPEALHYVRQLMARRKVSWRIIRDRYDPVAERFKGRRVLHEQLFEGAGPDVKGPAAKAREMERLVEERQKRVTGGTLGQPIAPNEGEDESTVFERFVMMRRAEAKARDGKDK